MRRTFWTLMLTGIAVTAVAGFSPTTQEVEAGLFSRLRAHFHGNCGNCAGEFVSSCACPPVVACPPVATCACPPMPTCAIAAPCGGCGNYGCGGGCASDCDNDHDDDCDD